MYLGFRPVGSIVYIFVTTHAQTGASIAPSSAFEVGDFLLYKNGSATQRSSTAGWSITSPFDSITGLHVLAIDLSDNTDAGFYAAGSHYDLVLSPDETIDGLVVVRVVAAFDIGVEAVNVTQVGGTAQTAGDIMADTNDIQSRLPAALVSGRIDASVGAMAANVLTATAINADAITAAKVADGTIDAATFAASAITATAIAADAITAAKIAADAIGASELAADAVTEIANVVNNTCFGSGSLGEATYINSNTILANIAIIDDFLDTEIAAILAAVDTEVAAIKAKTDSLTFTVANKVVSDLRAINGTTVIGDGNATPWGP